MAGNPFSELFSPAGPPATANPFSEMFAPSTSAAPTSTMPEVATPPIAEAPPAIRTPRFDINQPRPQTPSFMGGALPLLAAVLAGGKHPAAIGAGLAAYLQGKRLREAERIDAAELARKRHGETAEFYSRALSQASTIDDPVTFEQWKDAIAPVAQLHGIDPQVFVFNNKKLADRTKKDAADLLATLDKQHPSGNYTADWKDPKTGTVRRVTRAELARIAEMATFDTAGNPIAPTLKPAQPKALQAKNIVVNGKRISASFDPDDGKYYDQEGKVIPNAVLYDDEPGSGGSGAGAVRTNARIDRAVAAFNNHPIVKEFNEVQAQEEIIKRVVNGAWTGPNDMAIVFAFMKALDPTSVVRETEYANAARSGNIFAGWAARFNGMLNPSGGFLSAQVRQDFLRTITSRMETKRKQYQNLRTQSVARIDRIRSGAAETGDEALIDYDAATRETPTGGDAASALAELERRRKARRGKS